MATGSDSRVVSQNVEMLEQELVQLRASIEEDTSSFAELERQVAGLKDRLDRTVETISSVETRLDAKRIELVEAQRAEAAAAYRERLQARDERAVRVASRVDELLAELEAYDSATAAVRELLAELENGRTAGTPSTDVAAEVVDDPEHYREAWERLVAAVRARSASQLEDELVNAAAQSVMGRAIEDLPEHLQEAAHARRRARIKEHFGKR
jgi:predicted  nucleic acid-binding Zn-ribbon protein